MIDEFHQAAWGATSRHHVYIYILVVTHYIVYIHSAKYLDGQLPMAALYSETGSLGLVHSIGGAGNGADRVLGPPATQFGWVGGQDSRGWGG